jgi:hypothetical protein
MTTGLIRRASCALAAFLLLAPFHQQARAQTCDLALVLALDASSSVNQYEFNLQINGLADAFDDPDIRSALLDNRNDEVVWISAFEWSGRNQHAIYSIWTALSSDTAITGFASALRAVKRRYRDRPTAIGSALRFAHRLLSFLPHACRRQVVDVSGDGRQNDGTAPSVIYSELDFSDITVNGLVILGEKPDPAIYYREHVIHGPGAFVEKAADYADYAIAMKRKLLREIDGKVVAGLGDTE